MTDYNAITNATIDAESPITTQLMTYMRDNPIAIAEGSAGAPTIANIALEFPATYAPISNQTASASSQIDFTSGIDSTYRLYSFYLDKIRLTTSGANLYLLYSTDGGSSFYTTSYYDTTASNAAQINLTQAAGPSWAANASVNVSGWVHLVAPSDSLNISTYWDLVLLSSSTAAETRLTGAGHRNMTTAVNAIRFVSSVTTIASGKFYHFGRYLA